MSLGQLGTAPTFQNHAQGLVGEFVTPAGKVAYLMTKARLGADATDPERRLTRHLVPVREVIPAEELDFNQLLQRDLDDHRVAVSLVPYLLNTDWTGPAFFPPIVAVALPFEGPSPSNFPPLGEPSQATEGLAWEQRDAEHHFRVRRLLNDAGQPSPVALGQVWWNDEFCRIVVIDGQHRAMALLAIDRTMRSAWQGSTGARYRYFYESRIKEALKGKPKFEIEVPVTLLWFPELFGTDKEPHKAARKLFVDVNKEARTPSESRLILLSDGELINIFTRTTLTQLRNQSDNEYLPLYCIEYDNPDTKTTQSARWSALSNIHALKQMVTRTVFGPTKYINSVDLPIGSREAEEERNSCMRQQLQVSTLFPTQIEGDEPFSRDRLGNTEFPELAIPKLSERFRDTWSSAILVLLTKIKPWASHAAALTRLKQDWLVDDAIATLAHDALFSGVGMYWTLRDSAQYWQEEHSGSSSRKPDVVNAWEMITAKQAVFEDFRAEQLLGSKAKRNSANQVFQAMNTHACQLGIALTLATVFRHARTGEDDVIAVAEAIALGVNAWMDSKTTGQYDRRTVFARRTGDTPKHPINLVSNMDTPRAIQFRYFWLEILCSPQAHSNIGAILDGDKLASLRDTARHAYVSYIASEKARALRTSNPELTDAERKARAETDARSEVRQALIRWFDITATDIDAGLAGAETTADAHDALDSGDAELGSHGGEFDSGAEDPSDAPSEPTAEDGLPLPES
ncbi:MAG TPA: hypothetical protein VFP89_11420 [Propionibacteriaceae bacterium]|nr:hypothetical protein [Propionibacteriaceae bacterium]